MLPAKRGLFFLLAFVLFLSATYAFAEDDCGDCDRSLAPRLWVPDGDPATDRLPLKSSKADIVIDGPIARVTVTQRYGNVGQRPINARYVFRLDRAAVPTMKIGPRTHPGADQRKEEAKKIFRSSEAGRQARRPARPEASQCVHDGCRQHHAER